MDNRPSVLLLLPDMPAAANGGGPVREYHFARAIVRVADVSACVLVGREHAEFPPELARECRSVLQPPTGFDKKSDQSQSFLRGVIRAISVLIAPWARGGQDFMMAGYVNCVTRAESSRGNRLGFFHTLYAKLLQTEASLCWRFFRIFTGGALVRSGAFRAVFPAIIQEFKDRHPDIIWCEHSYMYPFAELIRRRFPHARLVCNAHNVEWTLHQGIAQNMKTDLARRWIRTEGDIVKYWEKRMLQDAELIICCSDSDAERFRTMEPRTHARIEVIPNGVDTEYFRPVPDIADPTTILFVGTAGFQPNDDAVDWMVRVILPLIRREIPQCRLCLAGRSAGRQWGHFAKVDPLIEVASDVPDMRPWFIKSAVCVVPLRSGSGTRLKILEAMSMGIAVVSTTLGAEGIEAEPDTHLMIADTPRAFADAVVALLENESKRRSLAQAGRELVCKRYQWSQLVGMAIPHIQQSVDRQ